MPARLRVLAVAAALVLAAVTPVRAATRPANDDVAAARAIGGLRGAAYGTLAGATTEPDCREPTKAHLWYGDRSVWFKWTPPTNGWVRFDLHTFGGWTAYADAYQGGVGNCYDNPWSAAIDSGPGYGQLEVRRGEPVWFAVYSAGAANAGDFALSWRVIPRRAPLNDHFADADVLWGRYGREYVETVNATRQPGEPVHAGKGGGRSIWYRWTAPHSGRTTFHTSAGPHWSCVLAVYTGTSLGTLSPVAGSANDQPGNSCTARFTATAGVTYRIAVDGERGHEARFPWLTWNSGPRPPNDAFAAAQPLTGHEGMLSAHTRGATDEAGEPRDAKTRSGSSVWYRWTAPDSGEAAFWVRAPLRNNPHHPFHYDRRVAVFAGTPGALTLRAASPEPPHESLGAHVTADRGTTYWVQVSGTDVQAVSFDLLWALRPDRGDAFAEAIPLPATGAVVADTRNATAEPGEPGHGRHGYDARRSLWFRWTAPATGQVTFDDYEGPGGHDEQPALSVYTGTAVGALTRVAVTHAQPFGWHTWSFDAVAGTTYSIALDADSYWREGMRSRLNWHYGTRELTGPTVSVTGPADGAVVRGAVAVGIAAADASGVWSTGLTHDWPTSFHRGPEPEPAGDVVLDTERFPDGPFPVGALAWDTQGNYAESAERTLVIDNRPPARRHLGAVEQLDTTTSKGIRWVADEPVVSARCSLDGAAFTECHDVPGSPHGERSYAGLAEGTHVFRIDFTDPQGRRSVDTAGFWWIVDTKPVGVLPAEDRTPPTVTAPRAHLFSGQPVGHTTATVRLYWTGRDGTAGVQRYDVHLSTDGGAWRALPSGTSDAAVSQLRPGHSYRVRVRGWDWAGNVSPWAYGTTFAVGMAQENAGWSLSPSWRRVALTGASGGYVARTGVKGAVARYAFTGRSVALYGPRLAPFGMSAVYLDGVRVATLDQFALSGTARAALFVRNGLDPAKRHVLEIRSLGAASDPRGGTAVAVDVVTRLR